MTATQPEQGPFLELLECRIAPATLIDASTVGFVDQDGDTVKVHFSKPILDSSEKLNMIFSFEGLGESGREILEGIDLTHLDAKKLKGLNILIDAEKTLVTTGTLDEVVPELPYYIGDDHVNVGFINAMGIDLGKVSIDGSLEKILAGDSKANTPGLGLLRLDYLGLPGSQLSEPDFNSVSSHIIGAVKEIEIHNDIVGAIFKVTGGKSAGIGKAFIGGSLLGNDADFSGSIHVTGSIGKITVGRIIDTDGDERLIAGGDLIGGDGKYSGSILAEGNIGTVLVNGDVRGGTGENGYYGYSGIIQADGKITSATVGGDLIGGDGERSGMIHGHTGIGKVEVKGDIIGGDGYASGRIETPVKISNVKVGGSVIGGTANYAGSILSTKTISSILVGGGLQGSDKTGTGSIFSEEGISKLTINGDLTGGLGETSGSVEAVFAIRSVTVDGDLNGGVGNQSGSVLSLGGKISKLVHNGESVAGDGLLSGVFFGLGQNFGERVSGSSFEGGSLFVAQSGGASFSVVGFSTVKYADSASISGAIFSVGFQLFSSPDNNLTFTALNPFAALHLYSPEVNMDVPALVHNGGTVIFDGSNPYTIPAEWNWSGEGTIEIPENVVVKLSDGTVIPPGTYSPANFPRVA